MSSEGMTTLPIPLSYPNSHLADSFSAKTSLLSLRVNSYVYGSPTGGDISNGFNASRALF